MARKRRHSIFFWVVVSLLTIAGLILSCNLWVVASTYGRVYDSVAKIEVQPVGLVLGTSKKIAPNVPNRHFVNRIEAAAELYREGKVGQLLVSGHRDSRYYDETRDMMEKLKALGVPESDILADDRGARTFESVKRARSVFGFDRMVIVSDDFHVGRALFLADRLGIEAIALRSKSVDYTSSTKVRMREYFARVKAVLELYVWKRDERVREMASR